MLEMDKFATCLNRCLKRVLDVEPGICFQDY